MKEGILTGLRILDFTRVMAGPYATRILADFGAEVIKIQTAKTATGAEDNAAGYFSAWNRNKKSITLNMDHREARGLFCRLTALSDAVTENFSPRVMSNWGLDYGRLKEYRPDLIMLSMSALGQTGPRKDFVAYGPTLQALGGLTYLTSFVPDEPLGPGYAYADPIFGLYGAIGLLAALEHRDRTGEGQQIDLSGLETVCNLIGPALLDVSATDGKVLPRGNSPSDPAAVPHGCYRCRGIDEWCVIAVFQEDEWQALCRAAGHPEWTADGRFAGFPERSRHREELDALLEDWTGQRPAEEVVRTLQAAGVLAGVVQNARELAADPQLQTRDFFVTLQHPLLGNTTADTYPFRFSDERPDQRRKEWRAAPLLGEHNDYVFGELLGLGKEEIACLKEDGVIG